MMGELSLAAWVRPVRHADHVVLSVFVAGLMVGRTPEYLGKKIEATT